MKPVIVADSLRFAVQFAQAELGLGQQDVEVVTIARPERLRGIRLEVLYDIRSGGGSLQEQLRMNDQLDHLRIAHGIVSERRYYL